MISKSHPHQEETSYSSVVTSCGGILRFYTFNLIFRHFFVLRCSFPSSLLLLRLRLRFTSADISRTEQKPELTLLLIVQYNHLPKLVVLQSKSTL